MSVISRAAQSRILFSQIDAARKDPDSDWSKWGREIDQKMNASPEVGRKWDEAFGPSKSAQRMDLP